MRLIPFVPVNPNRRRAIKIIEDYIFFLFLIFLLAQAVIILLPLFSKESIVNPPSGPALNDQFLTNS